MEAIKETKVVIIGAGITGLTAALELKQTETNFIVLEKADRVGGVIRTKKENGFLFEGGPNSGVASNPEVANLFESLGDECELQEANSSANKRYILKNGKWEAIPSSLTLAVKTPLFTLKDKFRILGEPFRKKGANPDESLADLVKRRMGDSFLDYAIDPFILGVYAGDPHVLIPRYALPKLYNLEQDYGSFIGGAIKKKFETKTEEDKKATRKIFTAVGGLQEITEALYRKVGAEQFQLSAQSIAVQKSEDAYIVEYVQDGETKTIKTKNIISTVSSNNLARIFPFLNESYQSKLGNLNYAKVIEISIGFNKWNGFELDGFGGLIPFKEKRDILGVLFMSALSDDRAPEGGALFTVFMGGIRRPEIAEWTDEEVKEALAREFIDLMEVDEFKPDLLRIVRYSHAIPQYGIESGERFDAIEKVQQENKGLIIGGNLRNGIGMADRISQGKSLIKEMKNSR